MLSRTLVIPPFLDASRPGTQPRAAAPARPCDIWEDMLDHLYLVHPMGCDGSIVIASKLDGAYTEKLLRIRDITKRDLVGQQFLSMNRFGRRRLASMLTACGHVWVDLDPYGEDAQGNPLPYRGMDLEALMALLLAAIAAAGLPAPSYVTDSGRGLHLVWLCEALPGRAGEKMSRIQEALYGPVLTDDGSVPARRLEDPDRDAQEARLAPLWRLFKDAGLDRQTLDRSRVLRLWGSYNPSAGRYCRRLWPAEVEDVRRCTVDAIADAVLPLTGTAYRKRMAEKAARAAIEAPADPKPRRARASNPYAGQMGVWERKAADLMRLREHRGGIAVGQRHLWLFLAANAHAQSSGGCPKVWADLLAPLAGLSRKEALDCLGTLGRRMKRHEAGETREHKRQLWSPLYNYSGAKMASALGVTAEEADAAGLAIVRPDKGKAVPPIERQAQKRIRDGAIPQPARADIKLQAGRRGLALQAEGVSKTQAVAAVQAATGRGRTWAREAMELAASTPAEAAVETVVVEPVQTPAEATVSEPPASRKSGKRQVRFPRRYIGGYLAPLPPEPSAPVPQPSAPPADEAVRVRRYSQFFAEYRSSTAHWTILTVGTGRMAYEVREDMPLDAPDLVPEGGYRSPLTSGLDAATDARFAAVQADLHREATRDRRRGSRVSAARSPARRVAIAPLDVTAAAAAYRLASGR